MNKNDKEFITKQTNEINKHISKFTESVEKQWQYREEKIKERNVYTDTKFNEIRQNMNLLFEKTDKLKDSIHEAVKTIEARPCKTHDKEFESIRNDVNRLFGWLGGICLWLLTGTAIVWKKVFNP